VDWEDVKDFGHLIGCIAIVCVCAVTALFLFIMIAFSIDSRVTFNPEVAKIEQVRSAVLLQPNNEYIIQNAIQTNKDIAETQRYNKMPVIDWTITDKWDSVKLIDIPSEEK
jgi:hypothetical protein